MFYKDKNGIVTAVVPDWYTDERGKKVYGAKKARLIVNGKDSGIDLTAFEPKAKYKSRKGKS